MAATSQRVSLTSSHETQSAGPQPNTNKPPQRNTQVQAQAVKQITPNSSTTKGGPSWDAATALCMAKYAQAAYSEPAVKKGSFVEESANGTKVTFLNRAYYEAHAEGVLIVKVERAEQLKKGDWLGTTNPYVSVELDPQSWARTRTAPSSTKPVFNQTAYLLVRDMAKQQLTVKVTDDDSMTADDMLGHVSVRLSDIPKGQVKEFERSLQDGDQGKVFFTAEFLNMKEWVKRSTTELSKDSTGAKEASAGKKEVAVQQDTLPTPGPDVPVPCPCKQRFTPIAYVEHVTIDTQLWVFADAKQKKLCLAWRGTQPKVFQDVVTDLRLIQSGLPDRDLLDNVVPLANAKVHCGFLAAYNAVHDRVFALVDELLAGSAAKDASPWTIMVCGHSLGGALATLCSYELATRKWPVATPKIECYTIGSPRVGNQGFVQAYDRLVPHTWRIANSLDIVTTVPRLNGYTHVAHLAQLSQAGLRIVSREQLLRANEDSDLAGSDGLVDDGSNTEEIRKLRTQLNQADKDAKSKKGDEVAAAEQSTLATLLSGRGFEEHNASLYVSRLEALQPSNATIGAKIAAMVK